MFTLGDKVFADLTQDVIDFYCTTFMQCVCGVVCRSWRCTGAALLFLSLYLGAQALRTAMSFTTRTRELFDSLASSVDWTTRCLLVCLSARAGNLVLFSACSSSLMAMQRIRVIMDVSWTLSQGVLTFVTFVPPFAKPVLFF